MKGVRFFVMALCIVVLCGVGPAQADASLHDLTGKVDSTQLANAVSKYLGCPLLTRVQDVEITEDCVFYAVKNGCFLEPAFYKSKPTSRIDRAGMFTCGMLFRPFEKLQLKNGNTYYRGWTEQGIEALIGESYLEKMEAAVTYCFPLTDTVKVYTKNSSGEGYQHGTQYDLDPRNRYAVRVVEQGGGSVKDSSIGSFQDTSYLEVILVTDGKHKSSSPRYLKVADADSTSRDFRMVTLAEAQATFDGILQKTQFLIADPSAVGVIQKSAGTKLHYKEAGGSHIVHVVNYFCGDNIEFGDEAKCSVLVKHKANIDTEKQDRSAVFTLSHPSISPGFDGDHCLEFAYRHIVNEYEYFAKLFYPDSPGVYGYTSVTNAVNSGRYWVIAGPEQYLLWRMTFDRVLGACGKSLNAQERDYFAHVLLVALFDYPK